jgi:hypothetical protein
MFLEERDPDPSAESELAARGGAGKAATARERSLWAPPVA